MVAKGSMMAGRATFRTAVGASLAAAMTLGTGVSAGANAIGPPAVYAHQGGAGRAPENTLGAFRQAHTELGPRGVWLEMDLHRAADGVAVIHDATLDRATNCVGRVLDKTLADLALCDARATFPGWPTFEGVPSFQAVLAEGKPAGWRIMPELKSIPGEPDFEPSCHSLASAFVNLVSGAGFPAERVVAQSFWPPCLEWVEALGPAAGLDIPTAQLSPARLPNTPVPVPATVNGLVAPARRVEVVAPEYTTPDLNGATVALIQALGRQVVPWTVDAQADIDMLVDWHVDGIISNDPWLVYERIDVAFGP